MAVAYVRTHFGFSIKTAGTGNAIVNISTATTAGNTLVAHILFDNAAVASKPVVTFITKAAGETANWVFLGAARSTSTSAGAFASGEMWCIRTTVDWPVATYTINLDTSVTMKATTVQEFSGVLAIPQSTAGTAYSTTTAVASATTTGTAPVIGDLALGFLFQSNAAASGGTGDNDTTGGSWSAGAGIGSTGGSGATNNYGLTQYKILTAASHQTYNMNAATLTAGNGSIVAILQQYVPPAITQAAYQFFEDGTETGSVALAPQDTAPTVNVGAGDVNVQLRVRLQSTNAITDEPANFRLYFEQRQYAFLPVTAPGVEVLHNTYDIANRSANQEVTQGTTGIGGINHYFNTWPAQGICSDGRTVTKVSFALAKVGNPTGTFQVQVGWNRINIWQVADPIDVAALSTTPEWVDIPMTQPWGLTNYLSGSANGYTTNAAFWIYSPTGSTPGNCLLVGVDTTSPSDLNFQGYWYNNATATWDVQSLVDTIYRVYIAPWSHMAVPYDSPNLTDTGPTTNRLTGGIGSFVAGEVTEDGTANAIALPGNNHTELLFSFKLVADDLAEGQVLRFKVARNDTSYYMTYSVMPQLTVTKVVGPGPVNLGTASSNGVATVSAPLSVAALHALVASSAGLSGVSAPLALAVPVSAASAGLSTVTSALTKSVFLASTVTSVSTAGATTLLRAVPVAASVAGAGTAGATSLLKAVPVAASVAGAGTVTSAVAVQRSFAASSLGAATAGASLSVLAPVGGKIKVWTGSAFEDKPVKWWNGSSWVAKPVKVWSGSEWVQS